MPMGYNSDVYFTSRFFDLVNVLKFIKEDALRNFLSITYLTLLQCICT